MKAIEFLKSKGLLPEYASTFTINGSFGTVLLEKLLDEYAAQIDVPPAVEYDEVTDATGPGGTDPNKPHGKLP